MDIADVIALDDGKKHLFSKGSTTEKRMLKELKKINPDIVEIGESGGVTELYTTLASTDLGGRYGLTTFQQVKIPSTDNFHGCVDFARDMYYREGIIRTVIDLMVDFSCTQFENICSDAKTKKFFDLHCKYADMDKILRQVFWEYYLIEDVFIYRGDKQIVTKGNESGSIYYPYTVLNPSQIEVLGSLLFEGEVVAIKISQDLKQALEQYPKLKKYFLKNMPAEFKNLFNSKKNIGKMPLDPERVSRISRRRQQYQRYSVPFIISAAEPLQIKRRLREMDLSTAEGNINGLAVFKVGAPDFPATAAQLKALASLLQTSAKSYSLIWSHALDVEFFRPDFQSLYREKYEELDADIANSLGMPLVLLTGGGSSFANSWVAILALIERLERGRHAVKRWLESEYRIIAAERGLKEVPQVRFKRMNLRDDKVFKNVLMSLYDRGILDVKTLLDDADFDYDTVFEGKKQDKDNFDTFFVPYVPFTAPQPPQAPTAPKPTKQGPGGEGRPTTEISPNYQKRKPQKAPEGETKAP
jgi:hypothetical protein